MFSAASESSVFFGGSMVAAIVAGTIALFAPCCVSVMLPAYFAASFHNRRVLVAMTLLFAAGIATVIVPIALGASLVRQVLLGGHVAVYVVGALMLFGLSGFTLLGGQMRLPSPSGRPTGRGPLGVYALGLFSGVASSCCAPVLAGVIALSSVADSFARALLLGVGYVFGMVAPLVVLALLWDRFDWGSSAVFRPRYFHWHLGPLRRTISGTALLSGVLLALMGGWALYAAADGGMQSSSDGWQGEMLLWLQRQGDRVVNTLDVLPGRAIAVSLCALVIVVVLAALRQLGWIGVDDTSVTSTPPINETETTGEHHDQTSHPVA